MRAHLIQQWQEAITLSPLASPLPVTGMRRAAEEAHGYRGGGGGDALEDQSCPSAGLESFYIFTAVAAALVWMGCLSALLM